MKWCGSLIQAVLLLGYITSGLAASWTFTDATVSVQGKGSGVGSGTKEKLSPHKPLSKPISLGESETLKILLTAQDGKTVKRPNQAYLLLKDSKSNLDVSYPFSVKDTGKAKVDLSAKDLPLQFLQPGTSISASIVIGSFGSSTGYESEAFTLSTAPGAASAGSKEKALRYGKLPEIHHIFRSDPRSPNVLFSVIFTAAAIATIPILLGAWLYLGGNLNHLSKAMTDAPVSHSLFVGSIISLEGILFLYYTYWNLFQTLPALFAVGIVTYISGSRALTEVQDRRLAGLR